MSVLNLVAYRRPQIVINMLLCVCVALVATAAAAAQELPDLEWQELSQCYVAPIPEGFDHYLEAEQDEISQVLLDKLAQQIESTFLKTIVKEWGSATAAKIAGIFLSIIWAIPTVGNAASTDFLLCRDGQFTGSDIEINKPYMMMYVHRRGDMPDLPQSFELQGWTSFHWVALSSIPLLSAAEESQLLSSEEWGYLYVPKSPLLLSAAGKYRVDGTVFHAVRDVTPPAVLAHNTIGSVDGAITISFSEELATSSMTNSSILVSGSSSGVHDCAISFDQLDYRLSIVPTSLFFYEEVVQVSILSTVRDLSGNPLPTNYSFSFNVDPAPRLLIDTWSGENGSIDDKKFVNLGEAISIKAFPENGFHVENWYLNGVKTANQGNTYNLEDIRSSHSLGVTFQRDKIAEIALRSPIGGETFARGSKMPVSWSWKYEVGDRVQIILLRSGVPDLTISTSEFNDGSYLWSVPTNVAIGSQYRIRVNSTAHPTVSDESSSDFSILNEIEAPDTIWCQTCNDLQKIGSDAIHPRDGLYVLKNDISCNQFDFSPLSTIPGNYFRGTLDGRGFAVRSLEYKDTTTDYVGLFAIIDPLGQVRNLRLEDVEFRGRTFVGAIAGWSRGTILNCQVGASSSGGGYVRGKSKVGGIVGENRGKVSQCTVMDYNADHGIYVRAETQFVGGIVGSNTGGDENSVHIHYCLVDCDVWGMDDYNGGIAGDNYGTISGCAFQGVVYGSDWGNGGIVGWNHSGLISSCYNTGRMARGDTFNGGIAGWFEGGTIENCYAAGSIVYSPKGGLVGRCAGTVFGSFWDTQVTGCADASVDGGCNVENSHGEPTSEMYKEATYTTKYGANWDFESIWAIAEEIGYPVLRGIGSTLPAPDGFTASTALAAGVHLDWTPVIFDLAGVSEGAFYKILRSDDLIPKGPLTEVSDWITLSEYLDESALPGQNYYYWVYAAATNDGARASELAGPVVGSRSQPPTPSPVDLSCSHGLAQLILLQWDSEDANYYQIYRTPTSLLHTGLQIEALRGASEPVTGWQRGLTFVDKPPQPDHNYVYTVASALDTAGYAASPLSISDTGSFSNPDNVLPTITMAIEPEIPPAGQIVKLQVNATDNLQLDSVIVFWSIGSDSIHAWANIGQSACSLSHVIGALNVGDTLRYWGEVVDASGNRGLSGMASTIIRGESVSSPSRPYGLTALAAGKLAWFYASGSSCNWARPVEYGFDWGDGSPVVWGVSQRLHSWDSRGIFFISALARAVEDTSIVSVPSTSLMIEVFACDDSSHFTFASETVESCILRIDSIALDCGFAYCDELGVFDGNLCVGASSLAGQFPAYVTAWKDDPDTPTIDGFTTGNSVEIRLWRNGEESPALAVFSGHGQFGSSDTLRATMINCTQTSASDNDDQFVPRDYTLVQNYPNPFNPSTVIEFSLPRKSNVSITIFNLLGQRVVELVNAEYTEGSHRLMWDGYSSAGHRVSSGVYLYRLVTENFAETKKMILLR